MPVDTVDILLNDFTIEDHCVIVIILTYFLYSQEVHIPLHIKTVVGSLISKPKRIHFENSFPVSSYCYILIKLGRRWKNLDCFAC